MRDLLDVMWQRHTCRAAFDPRRKIQEADLQRILDAARWAPTAHNLQNFEIVVVDDANCLTAIDGIQLPPTETFVRENRRQLSLPEGESLRDKTGLRADMFPESWQEADSARGTGSGHLSYLGRKVQKCPVMLVVVHDSRAARVPEGESLDLMSLGCVMQNVWLMAESLGISTQILSAFSAGDVQNQVRRLLAIPEHLNIVFAARLGYPLIASESYLRVRRSIKDFTYRNRYQARNTP